MGGGPTPQKRLKDRAEAAEEPTSPDKSALEDAQRDLLLSQRRGGAELEETPPVRAMSCSVGRRASPSCLRRNSEAFVPTR